MTRKGVKRGKRELIFDFAKKKKNPERKIGSVLWHLSSKNNKKGIFQRTFSRLRV
jgi:hypothetical protein